jgi:hypothetical protein
MKDAYVEIAHHFPNEVRVGGALITLVEPHPGFEAAYNRWYEDDHFYSGAMAGPWVFSGRRFVATSDLRSQRAPVRSPVAKVADSGCYLSLYWITAGQEESAERWGYHAMADSLAPHGRGFADRTHVYTAFHRFQWAVSREPGPLRPETALDHPFGGLHMDVVDVADGRDLASLSEWLQRDGVPGALSGSDAAICVAFSPVPFAQGLIQNGDPGSVPEPEGVGRQLCLLWFLDHPPEDGSSALVSTLHDRLSAEAGGELRFSGPFLPTVPGTDRYVSELR